MEKEIMGLKKPEPRSAFCKEARNRLMHKISLHENETWFKRFLTKMRPVMPSEHFIKTAKIRMMYKIESARKPVFGWLVFTKRIVASTLVMAIAVTSVLFFMGGKQPVSAAENTYLEVIAGRVSIKHADRLIWDVITKQTELSAGDLIQLGQEDSAIIHFFDDTQVRLKGETLMLLSQMDVSQGYAKQGRIEVSLHKGNAWVQTLNVDDGSALFTMVTPDAIISTTNSSFDVRTSLPEPTSIRVFRHSVDVRALQLESRNVFASGKLNFYQQIALDSPLTYDGSVDLAAYAPISDLTDDDKNEAWVTENLSLDRGHLAQLRGRELSSIKLAAGTLPGQVLYPVKRAKERLNLALSFNDESQMKAQIDIANLRLSESVALIEQGQTEKAKIALAEYQNIVRQIAEYKKPESARLNKISNSVVASHQKTLIATLPGDSDIGIVKDVLDETKELLTEDPIEKADLRMRNSLEELTHVQDYIASGNFMAAKETLSDRQSLANALVEDVTDFADDDQKKEFYSRILEGQHEERRILAEISRSLADQDYTEDLVALAENADRELDEGIKYVAATAKPFLPDVNLAVTVVLPQDAKIHEFVDKVNIYKTFTGQKNQISRLFNKYPQYSKDMEFLEKLQERLNPEVRNIIEERIGQLEEEAVIAKSKQLKLKIDRAIQQRKMRVAD